MANYTQKDYDPSLNGYWRGTIDGAKNFGYPENYFFADTIRSIFIGFANFFNDIKVIRYNKFQEPVKVISVPIKFGPRKKSHDFRTEQESGEKYYITLPNLTYKMDSMQFDSNRAKGIYETRSFYSDDLLAAGIQGDMQERFWSDVQPVPYNINVSMDANCENLSDANQIVEQICSRFCPACFYNIKEFWFFNKRRSIKLILDGLNWDIQSDAMGEEDWRQIKVSFTFKIEVVLYKPIRDAQIVQKINTYLTMNKGDYLYHGVTFGNPDGSLTNKYDFSHIYGVKVAQSYVLDGNPRTIYDEGVSAYTTIYDYIQTDQLTTYEKDAKLLLKTITRWVPASENMSARPDIRYRHDAFIPVIDDNGNVVSGYHEMRDYYSDEWMTTKEYMSLSGDGRNNDRTIEFGSVTMRDQYDAPYAAYYSHYNEEGSYTEDPNVYREGNTDFFYRQETYIDKPDILFSGGRYKV